jgi:hypothetical protein
MDSQMMTGNLAAAWGARLADVDYIPAFPITPQTEIVEALAKWCEGGELAARFVTMDSEHSMMTAAGAAEATGARVFTATSSQGLLHAFEVLYSVSGWRAPLVLVNVSRARFLLHLLRQRGLRQHGHAAVSGDPLRGKDGHLALQPAAPGRHDAGEERHL